MTDEKELTYQARIKQVIDRVLWTANATEANKKLLVEAIAEEILPTHQARIRELRECIVKLCEHYGLYTNRDHHVTVANEILSRPDDLSALDAHVLEEKRKLLARAMTACHFEKVDYEVTKHPEDKAYNQAVDDCTEAIEKLAEELK